MSTAKRDFKIEKGFTMNQKKFGGLMKEILKFRDKRDWAQFHIVNIYIGPKVKCCYRVD